MNCVNCKHLNVKDKKEGCVNGCLYYCSLKKEYVYVTDNNCNEFEKDLRDSELIEKMIKESKEYDDIAVSPEVLLILFFILVIIGIVMGVF